MYSRYYEEAAQEVIGWIYIDRHVSCQWWKGFFLWCPSLRIFGVDTFFRRAIITDLYPVWGIVGIFGVERYPVNAWAILGHHGRQQSVWSGRSPNRKRQVSLKRFSSSTKGIARTSPKLAYPPPNQPAEILNPPLWDTKGNLGDNFDLYPPKTQPSQNSYTPRG